MREKHLLLFEHVGDKQISFGFASFDKLPSTSLRAGRASFRGACPEPFGPEDLRTEGRQEQILRRFAPQDDSEGLRMTGSTCFTYFEDTTLGGVWICRTTLRNTRVPD